MSKYFQLDRLSTCATGPWLPNRFDAAGNRSSNGQFEGRIYTAGGVMSRIEFDGAAPTNFRILSMAGNLVRLAWTMPVTTAATTGIQLEGGLAKGQVSA